jgi:cullin-4
MKPARSSNIENTILPSDTSAKRKLDGKPSDDSIPNSYVPPPILPSGYSRPRSPKRLKISNSSENSAAMSKVMGTMSQTQAFADSPRTVPSGFEPHKGAKVLKIKNLRTTPKLDLEEYYDRTWTKLDAAVSATFEGLPTALPLDVLCRGVEATCRRGRAEKLASHLKDRCKTHLEKQVLPRIERDAGSSNVDALRAVYGHWTTWNSHSVSYLTRYRDIWLTYVVLGILAHDLQFPRSIILIQH